MKTIYYLFMLTLLVSACHSKTSPDVSATTETEIQTPENAFFTIDFAEIIKHPREVNLSEIADSIEYIPLEKTPESLLGTIIDIKLSAEYIFIKHVGSPLLTQFSRDGKFIRQVGVKGRGPKEYSSLREFSLDEKNQLIYLQPHRSLQKILIYNFDGEYIRTIQFESIGRGHTTWSRDSFLVSFREPQMGTEPFVFIETDFHGDTIQGVKNHIFWDKRGEGKASGSPSMWRNKFYWAKNKLHMKGYYNDTVYSYNAEGEFTPEYFVDLKNYKIPEDAIPEKMTQSPLPKDCYWIGLIESKKYIFIRYGSHMGSRSYENIELSCILYNKKNREGVALKNNKLDYGFINDLDGGPDFQPGYSNDTLAFIDIPALDMKLYLDSKEFKNREVKFPEQKKKLIELNKTLKEDDNHFLILVKLKD